MHTLLFLLNAAADLETGFILKPERKIISPSQTFIFEARKPNLSRESRYALRGESVG